MFGLFDTHPLQSILVLVHQLKIPCTYYGDWAMTAESLRTFLYFSHDSSLETGTRQITHDWFLKREGQM